MNVNIRKDKLQHADFAGNAILFTKGIIPRDTVPDGWYCYDLRGTNRNPTDPIMLEDKAVANRVGTILAVMPLKEPSAGARRINSQFFFLGESINLKQFCNEHGLAYPRETSKFILRPASPDEAGLFYSQAETDAEMGTVGHLRLDFGRSGDEFWTTWWPHNGDELNTPAFKAELDEFVNELRSIGPLQNRSAMSSCCYEQGGKISENHHGFVAESEQYRYCLRCFPRQGEYDGYLYVYDKRQQELAMAQEPPEQDMMGGMKFE